MLVSRASVPDIETENLSGYTREVEQNANRASVLTERALLSREQEFRESINRYPPMAQLPAVYDADVTNTRTLLSFGLGITHEQLLAYTTRNNIRAPWAPEEPITDPAVAWIQVARPLMERLPGFVVYYRRPFSLDYEGLLALY